LRLYVRNTSSSGGHVSLASNAWSEGSLTWLTAPQGRSGVLDTLGPVQRGTWVEFDVTAAVRARGTVTFALASSAADAVAYGSRESRVAPQLVLDQRAPARPNRQPGPPRVALIGDSITGQYSPTVKAVLTPHGYRVGMFGYGGEGLLDAAWTDGRRIAEIVTSFDPDIVVLQSVGNFGFRPPADPSILANTPAFFSAWQRAAQLDTDLLTARGTRVYWILNHATPRPTTRRINLIYRAIAATTQGVGQIDAYGPFGGAAGNPSLRTTDLIHLSDAGILTMGALVTTAVDTPAPLTLTPAP
jgi:hypothetical protein